MTIQTRGPAKPMEAWADVATSGQASQGQVSRGGPHVRCGQGGRISGQVLRANDGRA